jgi:hypothetical protein
VLIDVADPGAVFYKLLHLASTACSRSAGGGLLSHLAGALGASAARPAAPADRDDRASWALSVSFRRSVGILHAPAGSPISDFARVL